MTRDEIIKGLRLHAAGARRDTKKDICQECPYYELSYDCVDALIQDAYFITRQPAPVRSLETAQLIREAQDMATETLRDLTETLNSLHVALAQLQAEQEATNGQ